MKIKDLKKLSDGDLAGHQAQYKTDTRPWKVCELEFKRRERWRNVIPSIVLVIVGFILGLIPSIIDKTTAKEVNKVEIINIEEIQKNIHSNQSSELTSQPRSVVSEK